MNHQAGSVRRHYLDHAASAPLVPEAAAAMARAAHQAGNPASLHGSGRAARALLEDARESLATDLGCHPTEIIFTSGGTEADNLAVLGSWQARRRQRTAVVSTTVEHPAITETMAAIQGLGGQVRLVGVDVRGVVDPAEWQAALDPEVAIASVQWINNETGVAQDVAALGAQAGEVGAWVHVDGVQAVGHWPVDFAGTGLDLLSISAHKVGGPVGVGALVARREIELAPLGFGGGQERKIRSGTVPVALVVGFAAAVRVAVSQLEAETQRLSQLGESFAQQVIATVEGVRWNGQSVPRSPAIINLTFADVRADDLLLLLDMAKIDCSTGSACHAGVSQPSEVLLAMGASDDEASGSLRFSFGATTTADDIAQVLAVLPAAVQQARRAWAAKQS